MNHAYFLPEIKITYGSARSGVTVGAGAFDHLPDFRYFLPVVGVKFRCEPSLHYLLSDRFGAPLANCSYAFIPGIKLANFWRGVGKHQVFQPLWRIYGEPHSGHSSDRQAAKIYALEM